MAGAWAGIRGGVDQEGARGTVCDQVTHREPRRVPGYALVVTTDGPKLKTVDLECALDTVASTDRPSVFTALQEQLGLRLDPRQVQVEKLIIDAAERPGEN
jgi:hypothetical protein